MMPSINPIFADGIDLPIALVMGMTVLVPLLAFEVVVEALVLKKIWSIQFRTLCRYTFIANVLSLLAGIPVKILNAFLYFFILPQDLPGYFTCYPWAVGLGSLIYFVVTVGVEGAYAIRWLRRRQISLGAGRIWKGALLANLASYAVLAPLYYYLTRPMSWQVHDFTPNAEWTSHPTMKVIYIDAVSGYLKTMRLDGSGSETVVPIPVTDYLLSSDLNLCLFGGTNGDLYLYNRKMAHTDLVPGADDHISRGQVAFSPSGQRVAFTRDSNVFASDSGVTVEVIDLVTGQCIDQPLDQKFDYQGASIAWSTNENEFYLAGIKNGERLLFTILPADSLLIERLAGTNAPPVFACYGRIGEFGHGFEGEWKTFNADSCGELNAYTEPGLVSNLQIFHGDRRRTPILTLSVDPGLLHMARFYFSDVAFLPDCNECLFDANGYTYLLDIQNKRVGTVAHGDRFIILTPRYQRKI